jgi:hypothetical protein
MQSSEVVAQTRTECAADLDRERVGAGLNPPYSGLLNVLNERQLELTGVAQGWLKRWPVPYQRQRGRIVVGDDHSTVTALLLPLQTFSY